MAQAPRMTLAHVRTLLPPAQVQAADHFAEVAAALRREVEALKITDGETRDRARVLVVRIAEGMKQAEARRKSLADPLQAQVDAIALLFRESLAPIREADRLLREKLVADHRAQEAAAQAARQAAEAERARAAQAAQEAQQRAEAAAQAADVAPDAASYQEARQRLQEATAEATEAAQAGAAVVIPSAQPVPKTTAVEGGGAVTIRRRWTYSVEAPGAVPREYLTVDHGALRRAVNAGVRAIAGVRIYEEDDVAARTD